MKIIQVSSAINTILRNISYYFFVAATQKRESTEQVNWGMNQ